MTLSGQPDEAGVPIVLERRGGAGVVRVDSGGGLIGALLAAGLLDELSLLVHPCLAGAQATRFWYGSAPGFAATLRLISGEELADDLIWLRNKVDHD